MRTVLLGDPAITAVVGDRVHFAEVPLQSHRPCLVYRLVSTRPNGVLRGRSPIARYWYQVGARAQRAVDAEALANLVRARLDGYSAPPGSGIEAARWLNRITGWDPTLETHAVDDDFAVWSTT